MIEVRPQNGRGRDRSHGSRGRSETNPSQLVAPTTLGVYFRVGPHMFALDTAHVDRLLLPDLVQGAIRRPPGSPSLVKLADRWYAAANLRDLMQIKSTVGAIVMVKLPDARDVTVALHTGPCVKVAPMPVSVPVPPGIIGARARAVVGAFPATAVKGGVADALVGLVLDVRKLWTDDEVTAMIEAVEAATTDEWNEL